MEYKIKASFLVFGLFVALTGSIITVEDWQSFSHEEKIELIMTAEELKGDQKTLLLTVLQLEHDDLELQELVERQALEARKIASSNLNLYQKEQWQQAAKYFESSAKTLQDLRALKKTFEGLQKRYQSEEIDARTREALGRTLKKNIEEVEQRGLILHDQLQQAFFAIGLAEKYKEQDDKEKQTDDTSLIKVLGIISMFVGLIISLITAAKLIIDYRKSKIELSLLKIKVD